MRRYHFTITETFFKSFEADNEVEARALLDFHLWAAGLDRFDHEEVEITCSKIEEVCDGSL